ncbi:MAG: glycosyltransferase family 39 protein [Bacteroidota bacterium]
MDENKLQLRKDGTLLFLIISIHIICWFAMKPIFPQSDPLVYFINAKRILNHEYFFSYSIQGHRFGVFVPQAFFMWLFGESPYIINLWVLICSILTIVLVYFFVQKNISTNVAFTAGLLLSVNLIQIIYSVVVFPDNIASFFILICACFIYRGRRDAQGWLKNSLGFILGFALAFTAKESIILIIPFTIFIFWNDWRKKQSLTFQKSTGLLLIAFVFFIFTASKILTGDFIFFYRSFGMYQDFVPFPHITAFIKRFTYEPLLWLNSQVGYIFLVIFCIPSFISGIRKKDNFISTESYVALYFAFLLMELWWGNISLNFQLGALTITDRRWMMIIAPLCILSALTIQNILCDQDAKKSLFFLIIAFALLAIFNTIEYSFVRGCLFFAFASMLILQEFLRKKIKDNYWIRIGIILLPFFILAIQFLRTNSNYVVPVN